MRPLRDGGLRLHQPLVGVLGQRHRGSGGRRGRRRQFGLARDHRLVRPVPSIRLSAGGLGLAGGVGVREAVGERAALLALVDPRPLGDGAV